MGLQPGAPPEIQVDPEQLKEVLINLLENACEAMKGGGEIVIHEEKSFREPYGPAIVIWVTDTGPGIQTSIQEKVFQPFFTTREEGTGLGLSIACRIMEGHGGSLELISERGEGSTLRQSVTRGPTLRPFKTHPSLQN